MIVFIVDPPGQTLGAEILDYQGRRRAKGRVINLNPARFEVRQQPLCQFGDQSAVKA
jgi:hypothetical protein